MAFVSTAFICLYLMWEFLWPAYRDFYRRSSAVKAMTSATIMQPIIAERLRKREGAISVNADLRIQAEFPITGGFVAPDGTVVVNANVDYFVPFTFILHPQLNSKDEVEWTCGVATEEQTRYVSRNCRQVLNLPSKS
jgi:hypothetical protein